MTPHLLTLLVAASAKSSSKSSGSSYYSLIFLVAIFVGAYFLLLRPRQKRMRAQQAQARELEVGSEVMSVGGIMGTIVGMTDTTFDVEVSDGVVMTFIKRAVNARPPNTGGSEDGVVSDDMPDDPWDAPPEDDGDDVDPAHDGDVEGGPGGPGKGKA